MTLSYIKENKQTPNKYINRITYTEKEQLKKWRNDRSTQMTEEVQDDGVGGGGPREEQWQTKLFNELKLRICHNLDRECGIKRMFGVWIQNRFNESFNREWTLDIWNKAIGGRVWGWRTRVRKVLGSHGDGCGSLRVAGVIGTHRGGSGRSLRKQYFYSYHLHWKPKRDSRLIHLE